ncbi:hypothetical protein [Saliniramus fredricksonii]|uniref:hypothetical protein n=1 Tax=Saliniramus fredricksonii TaxID=1653334 RepID=UPI0013F4C441|nr:hypothetical protein [Saliniramus fredricksonii]
MPSSSLANPLSLLVSSLIKSLTKLKSSLSPSPISNIACRGSKKLISCLFRKLSIIDVANVLTMPTRTAAATGVAKKPNEVILNTIDAVIIPPISAEAIPFAALSCPAAPLAAPNDISLNKPFVLIIILAILDDAPATFVNEKL